MHCTQCGKPLTPLACDACGAPLGNTTCEACGGPAPSCSVCGHTAQPAPQPCPQQQPAAPCTQAPPQGYCAPSTPPSGPVPPYGVPPHMAAPSYPYAGPVPTKKVPIGGWLLLFLVFTCIGLAYQAYGLVVSLTASSINFFSIFISLVFFILPATMIVYYIAQRNIKFKYWFYFSSVITFASIALGVVGLLALKNFSGDSTTIGLIGDSLAVSGLSDFILSESFITIVVVISIAILAIAALVQVLWLVYFSKSRRVAYTFNPYNNPPQ